MDEQNGCPRLMAIEFASAKPGMVFAAAMIVQTGRWRWKAD
ncbi:MAG: hypothetical protein ABI619_07555 [Betaproteobacteria bacterium]